MWKESLKKLGVHGTATIVVGSIAAYTLAERYANEQWAPIGVVKKVTDLEDVTVPEVAALGTRVTGLSDSYALAATEKAKNEARFEDVNKGLIEASAKILVIESELRHVNASLEGIAKTADRLLTIALDRHLPPPGPAQPKPPAPTEEECGRKEPPPECPKTDPARTAEQLQKALEELLRRQESNLPAPNPQEQKPDPEP